MKKEDHNAIPDSVLTKEFLSQFKTEDDVSKFLTKLHALSEILWDGIILDNIVSFLLKIIAYF